jgi:hypothetical protein
MCHDSDVARDRAAGAPEQEIEITLDMIEAGAAELFDDSPTGIALGPNGAEYYAEKVIKAALDVFYRGTWTGRKSPLEAERDEMEANML